MSKFSAVKHELLGSGTYGTVVRIKRSNGFCARKRIPYSSLDGIDLTAVRECTILNRFKHPYVLGPTAVELSKEGTVDIYFPLAQDDLSKWIVHASRGKRRDMMYQVAFRTLCTLVELHQMGLIHRDIKPSNIVLDGQQQTYLADFGSGREILSNLEGPVIPGIKDRLSILHTENMITYPFRPPEMDGRGYTTKADIYSLGCTLINLLVGRYLGDHDLQIPPLPSEWKECLDAFVSAHPTVSISPPWIQLIHSMIHPNPESRPSALVLLAHPVFLGEVRPEIRHTLPIPSHADGPSHRPSERLLPHPYFPELINVWYNHCISKDSAVPLSVSTALTQRMDRNLALFWKREKNETRTPTAVLACFRLVLKMVSADIPTLDESILFLKSFSKDADTITRHNLQHMESYIFVVLNFTIY